MSPADVKNLRSALNWTQEEMAAYLGVNRASVSRYESDVAPRGPVLKLMQKLADEFARGRRKPLKLRPRRRRPQSEALAEIG